MVCGFDTHHDKGQTRSVGALVASTNATFTRYVSSVDRFTKDVDSEKNSDLSDNMAEHMSKVLKMYHHQNGCLPEKIFVYRDGIGAGDVDKARNVEIELAKVNIARNNIK